MTIEEYREKLRQQIIQVIGDQEDPHEDDEQATLVLACTEAKTVGDLVNVLSDMCFDAPSIMAVLVESVVELQIDFRKEFINIPMSFNT